MKSPFWFWIWLISQVLLWITYYQFEDFKKHQAICIEKTSGFSFDASARYEKLKKCLEEKTK